MSDYGSPARTAGLIAGPTAGRRTVSDPARGAVSPWRRIDWVLVGSAVALAVLGSLLVWAATKQRQLDAGADPAYYFKRHLMNAVVGIVLGVVITGTNYRLLRRLAPAVYLLSCLGLVAVLAIGTTINGAHSWIALPAGFEVQPSEFAKVGLILSMATLLSQRRERKNRQRPFLDVPLALLLAAVPMGLIVLQPDIGTIFVFIFTIFGMFCVAGVSWRWMLALVAAGVVVAFLAVSMHVLKNYQLDRFRAFTSPDKETLGAAYNVRQARIAIGSGGWTGTGLFKGPQTNGGYVPEQQTDFVFSVAGEELGFVGAAGIVVLFALMLWRALRISGRSPDLFGRLVAAGVASWFCFQVFQNIGMDLGLMPVTGLPLPFVSYGGSSMFANFLAVGLLLNVHLRSTVEPRGR
ncbi:MAG: rod shape-determining protein RodA [Mycobacteriales bacterium]